jgi:late competence protein required for DNA uptake (superfamily II DNA/RNA helicase)
MSDDRHTFDSYEICVKCGRYSFGMDLPCEEQRAINSTHTWIHSDDGSWVCSTCGYIDVENNAQTPCAYRTCQQEIMEKALK